MHGQQEFNRIVAQFSARIYNHALRMLGHREDAEDATQEVFQRVFKGLQSFRGQSNIYTWIWKITNNVCMTMREKRAKFAALSIDEEQLAKLIDDNHFSNPEKVYLTRENREFLEDCFAQLPAKESAALMLFYLEDMDYKAISDVLEVPTGTVGTLLHRGRNRLLLLVQTHTKKETL